MSVPMRLMLFAALLGAVFGGAALAGGAIDPDTGAGETADPHTAAGDDPGPTHAQSAPEGSARAPEVLPGLASSQDGYTLRLARTSTAHPGRATVAFSIRDDRDRPVRTFDVAHDKQLHLIVARRDLSTFEHLHPSMSADGTWTATAVLPAAGTYRVFADFTIDGEKRTLGADLAVPGAFTPKPLPAPSATATDDAGLQVRLRQETDGLVAFDVLRDGRMVDDELEDYLGAKGHLVTLRAGDLAYLHTHPEGDRLAFGVRLPDGGTYRSWVQYRLDGRVHTAAFTQEAGS